MSSIARARSACRRRVVLLQFALATRAKMPKAVRPVRAIAVEQRVEGIRTAFGINAIACRNEIFELSNPGSLLRYGGSLLATALFGVAEFQGYT